MVLLYAKIKPNLLIKRQLKTAHFLVGCFVDEVLVCLLVINFGVCFFWNNGLREAVVTDTFLFLSTFFVQVLNPSYKLDK